MKCTWKDCNKESKYSQFNRISKKWSTLCEDHYEENIKLHPKSALRSWILAQGGSNEIVFKSRR